MALVAFRRALKHDINVSRSRSHSFINNGRGRLLLVNHRGHRLRHRLNILPALDQLAALNHLSPLQKLPALHYLHRLREDLHGLASRDHSLVLEGVALSHSLWPLAEHHLVALHYIHSWARLTHIETLAGPHLIYCGNH